MNITPGDQSLITMPNKDAEARESQPHEIHLVGINLGHALTPAVHNFVARSIDVPWQLIATECQTISQCVRIFHSPNQAGGVVTMPWKGEIMKHLDRLDETANALQACNVVYFDESGKLCGSNTDWIGIEGAIRAKDEESVEGKKASVAAVIGAGGAARAAIYALHVRFGVREIYVVNRDDEEVVQLVQDCSKMGCQLLHVKSVEQAQGLRKPSHIVGAIPDVEASMPEEKEKMV
jgi:quinate dehydrogenase